MKRLLSVICATVWATLLSAQHIVTPLHPDDVINETQWKGQWIGIDRLLPGEEMENKTRVNARYLRKEFTLEQKTVRKARAFVASQGYYELYVNGRNMTKGPLAPYISNPEHILYDDCYDITLALLPGKNAIGVLLGNGADLCRCCGKCGVTPAQRTEGICQSIAGAGRENPYFSYTRACFNSIIVIILNHMLSLLY